MASSGTQSIEIFETLFCGSRNHTKTYEDLIGLEVSGAMKNPIAIACGIASGIPECGSNFEGELISLGYSEIITLLKALEIPIQPVQEYGLADLIASCTSRYSRNKAYGHRFVHKLISGEDRPNLIERIELFFNPAEFIQKEVSQSESHVEGAFTLASIISLAEEKKWKFHFMIHSFKYLLEEFLQRNSFVSYLSPRRMKFIIFPKSLQNVPVWEWLREKNFKKP